MRLCDYAIYEIKVSFTQTSIQRDDFGDKVDEAKWPETTTLRLIADQFYNNHKRPDGTYGIMIEGWVAGHFRHQMEQDFKILSVTQYGIDGALISL